MILAYQAQDKTVKSKIQSDYRIPDHAFNVPFYLVDPDVILSNVGKELTDDLAGNLGWEVNFKISEAQDMCMSANPASGQFGSNSTITITYGEVAENHAGMEKLGEMAEEGLSIEDLIDAQRKLLDLGVPSKLERLPLPDELATKKFSVTPEEMDAAILIVPNGVSKLLALRGYKNGAKEMWDEQTKLEVDKRALMRKKVVNKIARWNLCFDDKGHSAQYEKGIGTAVPFADVPVTSTLREVLTTIFGDKAQALKAEGNYYYDLKKCYIGRHGDGERRIVIAARLGAMMPIYYQWYLDSKPVGKEFQFAVEGGSIYAMSSKALGTDWKIRSYPTLRHSAGLSHIKEVHYKPKKK